MLKPLTLPSSTAKPRSAKCKQRNAKHDCTSRPPYQTETYKLNSEREATEAEKYGSREGPSHPSTSCEFPPFHSSLLPFFLLRSVCKRMRNTRPHSDIQVTWGWAGGRIYARAQYRALSIFTCGTV